METNFHNLVLLAKKQSSSLITSTAEFRNDILASIVKSLKEHKDAILQANKKDQEFAKELLSKGEISNALFQRMCLNEHKFQELLNYPTTVANLTDPIKQVQYQCKLDEELHLKRYAVPLGVLLVIFESRPEVLIQISALVIKSGNGVLLKGGSEAKHTNQALFSIIDKVLRAYKIQGLVQLIETREQIAKLLQIEGIDLVIPRGSKQLVQYIQNNTKIPVMGHTDGICHTYIDQAANKKKAIEIVIDGKCEYPAACNTIESLLLHQKLEDQFVIKLLQTLQNKGVELRLAKSLAPLAKANNINYQLATEQDWKTEYTDKILSVKQVASVEAAIEHITLYGSQHTETIITEDTKTAEQFLWQVDAAGVFHNASTRFSDGHAYGLGAEVGVSTNKLHARGPVGLEGLMSYKYILEGNGQIKASYAGKNAKAFLHKK